MTAPIIGTLLLMGGAMLGIAADRVLLRRWIRRRGPPRYRQTLRAPALHGRKRSARQIVEDVDKQLERAETRETSAQTALWRVESSLDALRAGLVLCDSNGRVAAQNSAATQLLQARHGEALVARVVKDLLERARSGERVTTRVELHTEPRRSYEVEAGPVQRADEILGAVALVHDITEHDRIESVRRDFVANVSHELKTPIGALSLLADSLVADQEPEVVTRLAARMQIETQRVAATIDDLLTLAMLEDDSSHPAGQVDMAAAVAAAVDRISETAEQRDVKVVPSVPAGISPIRGSRLQLESAVFNLLDNAVKFSDPGGRVDVDVEIGFEDDRRTLTLRVADEGIGIPPAEQSRVFERFYRVDWARSRNAGGIGLGLSIVRHVAINHGGDVAVTSREGYGTQFTIKLPLDDAN